MGGFRSIRSGDATYLHMNKRRYTHFVRGVDLRDLTRAELIEMKTEEEEVLAECKLKHRDASVQFNETGIRSDPEWFKRLTQAMKMTSVNIHRINSRLTAQREEAKERNKSLSRPRNSKEKHLAFLHAFKRVAKANLGEAFYDLAREAEEAIADLRPCQVCEEKRPDPS